MSENKRCNYCGKLLDEFDLQGGFIIHKIVGYGSTHDGEEISLQLCCECFDKVVDKCEISPAIRTEPMLLKIIIRTPTHIYQIPVTAECVGREEDGTTRWEISPDSLASGVKNALIKERPKKRTCEEEEPWWILNL